MQVQVQMQVFGTKKAKAMKDSPQVPQGF